MSYAGGVDMIESMAKLSDCNSYHAQRHFVVEFSHTFDNIVGVLFHFQSDEGIIQCSLIREIL